MPLGDNRFSGVRALIFDLDGTLIDSKLDLALSINATLDTSTDRLSRKSPLFTSGSSTAR